MFLGEIVKRDREKAELTQAELAERLNTMGNVPDNPRTNEPRKVSRVWITKLESGRLQRNLSNEVREWLATALDGDTELYDTLPVPRPIADLPESGEYDVLPLIRHLAKLEREKLSYAELIALCKAYRLCEQAGISLIALAG